MFRDAVAGFADTEVRPRVRAMERAGQIDPTLAPPTVARIIGSTFAGYIIARVFLAPDAAWDDERETDAMIRVLTRGLL